MSRLGNRIRTGWFVGSVFTLALTLSFTGAYGSINLEWRPESQTVVIGETVSIGLYVVSDDDSDQSIAAMDVILDWDSGLLEMIGIDSSGPYVWMFLGFPDDSGLGGLNDTFADGDALLSALSQLGSDNAARATPDGLLVATIQFVALAGTPLTVLTVPEQRGQFTRTVVFDGETPSLDVHGDLGSASVTVWPCDRMDADSDTDIDLLDFARIQICFTGSGFGASTACQCAFDSDVDHDVDTVDFEAFADVFAGPVTGGS
jgi:hypothetical protein